MRVAGPLLPEIVIAGITANGLAVMGSYMYGCCPSLFMRSMTPCDASCPLAATAVVLAACLLAAGCTGQAPGGNTAVPGAELNGTAWNLLSYEQNGSMTDVLEGTTVTLIFGRNDTLSGSAGCNAYSAGYLIDGTGIAVGPAISTLMYCEKPGVMEQESAYLRLLGTATSFAIEGDDTLTLADQNGTAILVFERAVPPEPKPLVGTNWTLESFRTGDLAGPVIAGTTVTGSAGCNRCFGSYHVSGASLSIDRVVSTEMACTGPSGIMVQEHTYLNALADVMGYAIEGDRLVLLDERGVRVLTFDAAD